MWLMHSTERERNSSSSQPKRFEKKEQGKKIHFSSWWHLRRTKRWRKFWCLHVASFPQLDQDCGVHFCLSKILFQDFSIFETKGMDMCGWLATFYFVPAAPSKLQLHWFFDHKISCWSGNQIFKNLLHTKRRISNFLEDEWSNSIVKWRKIWFNAFCQLFLTS